MAHHLPNSQNQSFELQWGDIPGHWRRALYAQLLVAVLSPVFQDYGCLTSVGVPVVVRSRIIASLSMMVDSWIPEYSLLSAGLNSMYLYWSKDLVVRWTRGNNGLDSVREVVGSAKTGGFGRREGSKMTLMLSKNYLFKALVTSTMCYGGKEHIPNIFLLRHKVPRYLSTLLCWAREVAIHRQALWHCVVARPPFGADHRMRRRPMILQYCQIFEACPRLPASKCCKMGFEATGQCLNVAIGE